MSDVRRVANTKYFTNLMNVVNYVYHLKCVRSKEFCLKSYLLEANILAGSARLCYSLYSCLLSGALCLAILAIILSVSILLLLHYVSGIFIIYIY